MPTPLQIPMTRCKLSPVYVAQLFAHDITRCERKLEHIYAQHRLQMATRDYVYTQTVYEVIHELDRILLSLGSFMRDVYNTILDVVWSPPNRVLSSEHIPNTTPIAQHIRDILNKLPTLLDNIIRSGERITPRDYNSVDLFIARYNHCLEYIKHMPPLLRGAVDAITLLPSTTSYVKEPEYVKHLDYQYVHDMIM